MSEIKDEKLELSIGNIVCDNCYGGNEYGCIMDEKKDFGKCSIMQNLVNIIHQRDIELNDKWHKAGYTDGVKDSLPAFPIMSEKFKREYRLEGMRMMLDRIILNYSECDKRDEFKAYEIVDDIRDDFNKLKDEIEKEAK